jgi:UDP-glucose 4-epimerase
MNVSKAIVTGGAGFIGSHIVDELIKRGIETFVIDDLSTGSINNLKQHKNNKLLHILIGDARRIGEFLSKVDGIDILFHEAAIASVTRSVTEPMVVHDVNVNMTLHVMNFCLQKRIKRFVFASSAAVYGVLDGLHASEDFLCRPSSPYGASKLAIENYLSAYQKTYGLETVILRYFNVFGPRQTSNDYSGVITIFINKLSRGEVPTIFGDGQQVRDFVNVKDIVQANILAMELETAVGRTLNVATGNSTSILELFELLREVTGNHDIRPDFGPTRIGDVRFGLASIDKIKQVLGYNTTVPMLKGLAEVVDYVRNQGEIQMYV